MRRERRHLARAHADCNEATDRIGLAIKRSGDQATLPDDPSTHCCQLVTVEPYTMLFRTTCDRARELVTPRETISRVKVASRRPKCPRLSEHAVLRQPVLQYDREGSL